MNIKCFFGFHDTEILSRSFYEGIGRCRTCGKYAYLERKEMSLIDDLEFLKYLRNLLKVREIKE